MNPFSSLRKPPKGIRSDATSRALEKTVRDATLHSEEFKASAVEQLFPLLANSVPVLIWIADTDKRRDWFNQRWLDFRGRTLVDEFGNGWMEGVHPDDIHRVREFCGAAFDRRESFRIEYRLRNALGEYRWILDEGKPLMNGSVFMGYVGGCTDIHSRKLAEMTLTDLQKELAQQVQGLEYLHDLGVHLSVGLELEPILDKTLRTAMGIQGTDMGMISFCDSEADGLRVQTSSGFPEQFLKLVDRVPVGGGACGTCYQQGKRVIVEDTDIDPIFAAYREAARVGGFRAVHSTPLVTRAGEVIGVLSTHFRVPHRPSDREINLIDLCARQATDCIQKARLYRKACEEVEERKRAEEQNRESRHLIETVVKNINEGITVQGKDGRLVFANTHAARLIGFGSVEELLAVSPAKIMEAFEVMDESGKPFPFANFPGRRVLAGEPSPEPVTMRFRAKATGEERWSVVRAEPIRGPEGEVKYALNFFRDVTEERRAEELSAFIEEASIVLSSSLDHTTILKNVAQLVTPRFADWCTISLRRDDGTLDQVAIAHENSDRVEWVKRFNRDFPPTRESSAASYRVIETGKAELYSVITEEMLKQALPADPERLEVLRKLGMRSAMIVPLAARGKVFGTISFVSTESNRIFDGTDLALAEDLGRRIGMALDNARLYGETKRELAEREKAEEALRRSEEQYRSLLAKLPAGAYTCDAEGLITYYNDQAVKVWGRAPKLHDPVDRYCGSFRLFSKDGVELKHEDCWMGLALRHNKEYLGQEIVIERPDGSRITGLAHASPLHDAQGKLTGAVNIIVDISDRKQVEKTKSEFVSLASHQLRTPLTAIRWIIGTLQSGKAGALNEAQMEMIDEVQKCAFHMAETIGTMLMISILQMEDNRLHLESSVISPEEIFREICNEQRPMSERKRQEITIECEPGLALTSDRKLLKEALANLLSNAVKYTGDGGHIALIARRDEEKVTFHVVDDGCGIPKAEQERVFTKFFRAENVSKMQTEGTGLGLYLVHSLVQLLGGQISFTSDENVGTTFTLTFPSAPHA